MGQSIACGKKQSALTPWRSATPTCAIVLPPKGRREFAQASACAELIAKQEEPLRVRRRWLGKGKCNRGLAHG